MVCVDAMRHDDMAAAADGDLAAVHGQFTGAPMVMFPSHEGPIRGLFRRAAIATTTGLQSATNHGRSDNLKNIPDAICP